MNKREVVWLIVRLIGVYLGYLAIVTVFTLVSSVFGLYSLSSDAAGIKSDADPITRGGSPAGIPPPVVRNENDPKAPAKLDPATEKAKSEAFKLVLLYIFLTALYGGASFYLITRGTHLFNILNREQGVRREQEPSVTTLKL